MVDHKLEKIISDIQREHSNYFIKASDEDINKLKKLFNKYNLENVIDFYKLYQPYEVPSFSGARLLSVGGVIKECYDYSPGVYLYKFGLFPLANTIGGNLICLDANDVVNGEPSVLYAEHTFCFYSDKFNKIEISGEIPAKVVKEKGWDLDFNYENIKACLFNFKERFSEFLIKAIKGEYVLQNGDYYDIEDYVEDNRGEYI